MSFTSRLFKTLFKVKPLHRHYFGFYKHIFLKYKLFENESVICRYDHSLFIKVDLDEWIQQQVYFLGYYDKRGVLFLKNNLQKGDVFVDAGANIGCFTLLAAKLTGDDGKVYAFEPIDEIYQRLTQNIKLNNFKNVVAEQSALYKEKDKLTFYISEKDNLGQSGMYANSHGKPEEVDAITLDQYFRDHKIEHADMIKIDVEGTELYALEGMKTVLTICKPDVILEINNNNDENAFKSEAIINYMINLGYDQYFLNEDGQLSRKDPYDGYNNRVFKNPDKSK